MLDPWPVNTITGLEADDWGTGMLGRCGCCARASGSRMGSESLPGSVALGTRGRRIGSKPQLMELACAPKTGAFELGLVSM